MGSGASIPKLREKIQSEDIPRPPAGPIGAVVVECKDTSIHLQWDAPEVPIFEKVTKAKKKIKVTEISYPITMYEIECKRERRFVRLIRGMMEKVKFNGYKAEILQSETSPKLQSYIVEISKTKRVIFWTKGSWHILKSVTQEVEFTKLEGEEGESPLSRHIITDLRPVREYQIRIRAWNENGEGPWTNWMTRVTTATIPDRVPRPTVEKVTLTSIIIKWKVPNDNGSGIFRFDLEVNGEEGEFVQHRNFADYITHEISGLVPSNTYEFRVRAVNSVGRSDFSSPIQGSTFVDLPWQELTKRFLRHVSPLEDYD
eukprot:TRINITY_DN5264_c0_g1_i1.p1 TRINITY_DN5264_c0_g1~~TRINITY_DN5264_c0_g1_i1.p1  ORF type:complete len:314 (-),score=81.84 TRINITY_DN5264_c0_g1_i1:460-1401(-)